MWGAFERLRKSNDGATLVYVSLTIAVIFGFIGLAIDFSRHHVSTTQAQAAADAAALAAASQLDGQPGAISRATDAASDAVTKLVGNDQTFTDASKTEIAITGIRFLEDLPASDSDPITASYVTTDDADANFVEVTTASLGHTNFFLPAIGAGKTSQISADAVAGQESAICSVTPFAICNPAEAGGNSGASFDVNNWIGKQIKVLSVGGQATDSWAPGNFGFLDLPDVDGTTTQGAQALADMLAGVDGANRCFSTKLDTSPGAINSLRTALNTRFDMYENPFFGNEKNDARFPPAPNVIKGKTWTANGANTCHSITDPTPSGVMALPRDDDMKLDPNDRFGNGIWDCADYWAANHPHQSATPPAGCANNSNGMSRWEMYNYEIDNSLIPSPAGTGSVEIGAPQCYTGTGDTTNKERRMITFAVMNCVEHNVKGNSTNVPAEAFMRAFMTESVGDELVPGAADFEIYLEVVDVVQQGQSNGLLKEYVEIFR